MRGSIDAGFAERGTCPPFVAALLTAPQTALRLLGGALAMFSALRFAFCALVSLIAYFGAPRRKTPTWSRSARATPNLGGRDERSEERGACSTLCTTCNEASHANQSLEPEREFPPYHAKQVMGGRKRAVTPLPAHGAPKITHCFKNAGAFWGGHVPRSARPASKLPTAKKTKTLDNPTNESV